jgi:hypothetical protein
MNTLNNQELEEGIIVNLVVEPRQTLEAVHKVNLTAAHFANPSLRAAYEDFLKADTYDRAILNTIVQKHKLEKLIRDNSRLSELCLGGVTEFIEARARMLVEASRKNKTIKQLEIITKDADKYGNANDFAWAVNSIARQNYRADANEAARSLDTLSDPIPEEEDPRAIFKNGYLRRGGALVLAAQAGVGKSVISIQAAYSWAIGKSFMGITPVRPLKIGIIQSEDDETEMSDFRANIRKGLIRDGWTQDEIRRAEQNIFWEDKAFLGKAGDDFIATLRIRQMAQRYDLITINPLQAYFGGDISKNQDASHFFRQGLDPIIKDPECGCALFIIHHTNKPSRDNQGNRTGFDANSAYEGAGAAETTNWARAHLNLKATGKDGSTFVLVAAKRGRKLGWRDENGNITTKKFIAYSDDIIYWRELTANELPASQQEIIDPRKDAAELAQAVFEKPTQAMELRNYAHELFGKCRGDRAYTELANNLINYGLTSRRENKFTIYEVQRAQ